MRALAFITASLLATATVAQAQPWRGERHEDRYAREDIPRDQWQTFAERVRLGPSHGAAEVSFNNEPVRAIELQAVRGWSKIARVSVQYMDGRVEPIWLNRSISEREPNLRVKLSRDARTGVKAIVIYGEGRGAFRVIGG